MQIVQQNLEVVVVLLVAVREVERVLMIGGLATHGDGRLDVELQAVLGANELVQLLDVLEFRVAVEQQRRVVGRRAPLGVQRLEGRNNKVGQPR